MAQLTEILQKEKQRQEIQLTRKIYLYQEGSFYRAYEWSAWLCVRYVNQFKTTKRRIKQSEDTMVFIGFPVTSLEKFSPADSEVIKSEDKHAEILLPASVFPVDMKIETLAHDFNNWKTSLPMDQKKNENKGEITEERVMTYNPQGLTAIMLKVLAFPIEKKSPIDCMLFLAEIKNQITEIL